MKQGAVLCASGIGDGLLMMIAAHHLKLGGYEVVVFHDNPHDLSLLFEDYKILPHPPLIELQESLKPFQKVIIENDNSERAWLLFSLRDEKKLKNLTFLFPTPSKQMRQGDILFNRKYPFATNIAQACHELLKTEETKNNDLSIPQEKVYRKYPKRVVIHPTSNDPKRNWTKEKFLVVAKNLKARGYSVIFTVSPSERKDWEEIKEIELPHFKNIKELTAYLYESGYFIGNDSGIGHLASNLGIPTLTVSGNPKRVRLWRPDWAIGKVVTLLFPLPNFKGINLRIRENYWQKFISVRKVLKAFKELVRESRRSHL